MGKKPQSYTETYTLFGFQRRNCFEKDLYKAAHSMVVTCQIAISVFQGKTGGPNH